MKSDDLLAAISGAVRVVDLYDAVAAALSEAGIEDAWRPWNDIADQIDPEQPELARALRAAQVRWQRMMTRG